MHYVQIQKIYIEVLHRLDLSPTSFCSTQYTALPYRSFIFMKDAKKAAVITAAALVVPSVTGRFIYRLPSPAILFSNFKYIFEGHFDPKNVLFHITPPLWL